MALTKEEIERLADPSVVCLADLGVPGCRLWPAALRRKPLHHFVLDRNHPLAEGLEASNFGEPVEIPKRRSETC